MNWHSLGLRSSRCNPINSQLLSSPLFATVPPRAVPTLGRPSAACRTGSLILQLATACSTGREKQRPAGTAIACSAPSPGRSAGRLIGVIAARSPDSAIRGIRGVGSTQRCFLCGNVCGFVVVSMNVSSVGDNQQPSSLPYTHLIHARANVLFFHSTA